MDTEYILNAKILPLWLKFVIPSIIGVVLNTVYIMVDGIFVGQGTGEAGLAAVNLAWPAVTIILGAGLMLGAGSTILVSKELGADNKHAAEKALASTFKFIILIGLVLTIIGILLATPITLLLGAEVDTFDYTKDYFVIVYLMAIPYLFANTLTPLVRADGSPNLAMLMVGAGAIGNIILDWLLVIVFDLGTAGAALATGCGVILSTIIGLWHFTKGHSNLKFRKEYFKFEIEILKAVCKIGAASLFFQLSVGVIILVQNKLLYMHGDTADIAIFCVAGYVYALYSSICLGVGQGIQPVMAFHFGASSTTRLQQLLKITILVTVSLGISFLLALYFFGDYLIALYGVSEDIMELAYSRTVIFCIGAPALGFVNTMSAYYQSINREKAANIITIGRGMVLQTIMAIVLSSLLGAQGVFYAQATADFGAILLVLIPKKMFS
ncbi:MAG: MATE family efflux transporter [Epulopiscium sp. Nuni2H_MBin001]|nr:MAG: MATE family efflux transporter [Epulopiscium sp. Nuni2H_MBin001]